MIPLQAFAIIGLVIVLALFSIRLFIGPTLHDRLLAAQSVALVLCLIIAALAVAAGRADWVDVAIAAALGAFAAIAAACKFLRDRSFQASAGERAS